MKKCPSKLLIWDTTSHILLSLPPLWWKRVCICYAKSTYYYQMWPKYFIDFALLHSTIIALEVSCTSLFCIILIHMFHLHPPIICLCHLLLSKLFISSTILHYTILPLEWTCTSPLSTIILIPLGAIWT